MLSPVSSSVVSILFLSFQTVFNPESTQKAVYQGCVESLLIHLFDGQNASVFAYGPTGAGERRTISNAWWSLSFGPSLEISSPCLKAKRTPFLGPLQILASFQDVWGTFVRYAKGSCVHPAASRNRSTLTFHSLTLKFTKKRSALSSAPSLLAYSILLVNHPIFP